MIEEIKHQIELVKEVKIDSLDKLESFRIEYLGKKGRLSQYFSSFKSVPNERKKEFGQIINELKKRVEDIVNEKKTSLTRVSEHVSSQDYTKPGVSINNGGKHPLTTVKEEIISIFQRIGNDPQCGEWSSGIRFGFPSFCHWRPHRRGSCSHNGGCRMGCCGRASALALG